jgi:hypothetical protein
MKIEECEWQLLTHFQVVQEIDPMFGQKYSESKACRLRDYELRKEMLGSKAAKTHIQ